MSFPDRPRPEPAVAVIVHFQARDHFAGRYAAGSSEAQAQGVADNCHIDCD
jgi:hypothetical protein